MYQQNYDPAGNVFVSTILAAIPILTLLYFIALHPHRDEQGVRHLGISAPYAAFFGVIAAFVISCIAFSMPFISAVSAFGLGVLSGFLGIIWIVLAAMFLYTMTVVTGKFEIVKESIVHISFDRRLQCVLIAFSFGAIIEGTSGFGTPVAIAGAVMVGLGFRPFQSAVLNLLANTAPVAWGAIGTPIVTLAAVSGLDQLTLSAMAGRQLPWISILVPFWLVVTFVKMEGGTWKEAFEVWPAPVVAGVSFAVVQWFASSSAQFHLMTDVVSGVVSVVITALFLRFVWHPKTRFLLRSERDALAKAGKSTATATTDVSEWKYKYSVGETIHAWLPWIILSIVVFVWGLPQVKTSLDRLAAPKISVHYLDKLVLRVPPAVAQPAAEAAVFNFNFLSATGSAIFLAAIIAGFVMGYSPGGLLRIYWKTLRLVSHSLLTIAAMMAIGFSTRYSGMDATLGLAFAKAGWLYPFFGTMLGWLGVALTGSDTSSNVLFGSLQRITATQLGLSPILMCAANSSGGVMGKMIDAQSIVVASTATRWYGHEGDILRRVFFHSLALAALVGIFVLLQAYVFTFMIVK